MRVEQISIFLENTGGRIAEVTTILSACNVNIRALSLADTTDFGVLRLIVDDNEKAEKVLKAEGFSVGKTSVVAVAVEDNPGGLNRILILLAKSELNVEYMYALQQNKEHAVMIFRFDNTDEAIKLLEGEGIRVYKASEVASL